MNAMMCVFSFVAVIVSHPVMWVISHKYEDSPCQIKVNKVHRCMVVDWSQHQKIGINNTFNMSKQVCTLHIIINWEVHSCIQVQLMLYAQISFDHGLRNKQHGLQNFYLNCSNYCLGDLCQFVPASDIVSDDFFL